jgi:hypothetical protein
VRFGFGDVVRSDAAAHATSIPLVYVYHVHLHRPALDLATRSGGSACAASGRAPRHTHSLRFLRAAVHSTKGRHVSPRAGATAAARTLRACA